MQSTAQQQRHPTHRAPGLAKDLADVARTLRSLLDPYRPERHYMRGPGPKWHAKHDPAPTTALASAPSALVPVNG
jgi:hypothetical protein